MRLTIKRVLGLGLAAAALAVGFAVLGAAGAQSEAPLNPKHFLWAQSGATTTDQLQNDSEAMRASAHFTYDPNATYVILTPPRPPVRRAADLVERGVRRGQGRLRRLPVALLAASGREELPAARRS